MKIALAFALASGAVLPFAAPVSAQSRSASSARLLRRQSLSRLLPQLSLRPDIPAVRVGAPKPSASRSSAAFRPSASTRLNFSYVGFSSTQKSDLERFLNSNYTLITQVWGNPAPEQIGKTITITSVSGDSIYFPPLTASSGAGAIEFHYAEIGFPADNQFRLLKLVLNAFQGPRVPAFNFAEGQYVEPYLLGASEAAALQILYRALGSPNSFDPRPYADYVLPFYDAFNSPALGNAFIYSPDGRDVAVADFRLDMAQAAFLKLYTEKETFFADFNAALYAHGAARSPVSADDLESIAAGVVPTVEGLPFRAWVREQGALNARIQTGDKIYLVALPSRAQTGSPDVVVYAEAFSTDASGNDSALFAGAPQNPKGVALPAYGTLDAFDETGRNINSYSNEFDSDGKDIPLGAFGFNVPDKSGLVSAPGEAIKAVAFSPFGSPVAARVTLRARLNTTEATTTLPFAAAGTTTSPSTFFGATLGGTTGTISLSSNGQNQNIPIVRGTFASTLSPQSGPRVQTTLSDGTKTFIRNSAWLAPGTTVRSLEFLLPGAGAAPTSSTLTLNTSNGRLKMIAFPLRPLERDEARALNLSPTGLLLARYRPDLSPATTGNGGLQFGVGGSKYELYPNISQGPEAGRGYWLQIPTSGLTTAVAGTFAPTNQNAEVELKGGWNQIGVPRATSIGALNVKVRFGGYGALSLQEAQGRGWIAPGLWRYNGRAGYERVDVSGVSLMPWEGYWVFASPQTGVSLVFEAGASTQSVRALSASGWSVSMAASSSRSHDTSASFGVSSVAPAAKPPVATRQLSVYFPAKDAASSSGSGAAQSFLKRLGARNEWRFVVDGAEKGERVTLFWPRFGAPSNLKLQLRDDATGKLLPMKAGGKWAFTSDGKPHNFSVVGTVVNASGTSANAS